jgi:hypothetical protein
MLFLITLSELEEVLLKDNILVTCYKKKHIFFTCCAERYKNFFSSLMFLDECKSLEKIKVKSIYNVSNRNLNGITDR